MSDTDWLSNVATEPSKLKREAAKRKKPYQEISVAKSVVEDHLNDGWEIAKELKIKTRLRKLWTHDQRLENRVWYLFYLLDRIGRLRASPRTAGAG